MEPKTEAQRVAQEYGDTLSELNSISKVEINALTMLAEDSKEFAIQIASCIEDHLRTAPSKKKLPIIYLIDSICKNFPKSKYVELFTQNIVSNFCNVFEVSPEKTRKSLHKLRLTWNATKTFPQSKLNAIDERVHEMDPNWPVLHKISAAQAAQKKQQQQQQQQQQKQQPQLQPQPQQQPQPPPPPLLQPQPQPLIQPQPLLHPQPQPLLQPQPPPQLQLHLQPQLEPQLQLQLQQQLQMQMQQQLQQQLQLQQQQLEQQLQQQQQQQQVQQIQEPQPIVVDNNRPTNQQHSHPSLPDNLDLILESLYGGKQCSNCSLRFDDNNKYAIHLDWHFRQNLKSDNMFARRKWYYPLNLWVQFREINDDEIQESNDSASAHVNDLLISHNDHEVPTAPASKEDEKNICSVCHETFEKFWAEEEEEWRLRNARLHDDQRVYHPLCLMDMLQANSIQQP